MFDTNPDLVLIKEFEVDIIFLRRRMFGGVSVEVGIGAPLLIRYVTASKDPTKYARYNRVIESFQLFRTAE